MMRIISILFLYCLFAFEGNAQAQKESKYNFFLRAGISGLYHYQPAFNRTLPDEIKLNRLGYGSTLQLGLNTGKTNLAETRHYIELNHIRYSSEVDFLGSFSVNKVFLTLSPYQLYRKLNPDSKNNIALEAGLSFGFNLFSKYNYRFLEEKRSSIRKYDETLIAGINVGIILNRMHFNKDVEYGFRSRFSPILGIFNVDHNYISTEFFYGIKF